ncbi:MAG: cadherin-like domain-containing protein, partial [Dongiaceae bacterium]
MRQIEQTNEEPASPDESHEQAPVQLAQSPAPPEASAFVSSGMVDDAAGKIIDNHPTLQLAANFVQMSMEELMQLDLIVPEVGYGAAGQVDGVDPALPDDLTELSLDQLMGIKVDRAAAPELPPLHDLDFNILLDATSLESGKLVDLVPRGTLPGSSYLPSSPPSGGGGGGGVPNNAPVAGNDSYTVAENGVLTVTTINDVLRNDTDSNGDPLTPSLVSGPSNGTISLGANGTFVYTPNANFNGTDSFVYQVSDGNGGTDTATVTIVVSQTNDPPVAIDDGFNTNEDTALIVPSGTGLLINDTDIDGNSLTTSVVSGSANGSLTLNIDGSFTYTPNAGFNGVDSFTYIASDGSANSNVATVTINVISVNDAPAATADNATVAEDGVLIGASVLGNDSDPDGDPLTAVLDSTTSNGTLSLNPDGTYTYTPNAGFNGADSFTYHAVDSLGATSNTVTVTINVTSVNDAPVATADNATVAEDGVLNGASVLANDTDAEGNPLTAVLDSTTSNGTLSFNPDGTYTYTPNANFNGADSFTYHAVDSLGGVSNTVTVTINVT